MHLSGQQKKAAVDLFLDPSNAYLQSIAVRVGVARDGKLIEAAADYAQDLIGTRVKLATLEELNALRFEIDRARGQLAALTW